MCMDLGALRVGRDIANQRKYFDLLINRNRSVLPALDVEVSEDDGTERANGGKGRPRDVMLARARTKPLDDVIACIEYDGEGPLAMRLDK